ncbi:MAG: hypothetical protein A2729_04115 [Candidatus Buchananbacteria bacterium RIFCSPHIGHO2_01_FULL_39_14]|uniref:Formyl transferase C-terminal domain-containing protein n=1 Tax=Candidatus Buchananbacteria bacterium RIFCSPHIGHO2_01_FULL_39_14 TaxID=1797532 RepID=A0A1G1XY13_9BACT|nr:MAG: hypothetical protein A2729_04115 [Candidatus Buchananbacteria bacterium RIFCSPHIGHO2_01_FULL_39_14]OGY48653.1 MAG: hypothetical protein A3D39_05310 [Candidatus Buchananbacteria bacterium RIFCSPHIGHO2_02_FULL_39_17]
MKYKNIEKIILIGGSFLLAELIKKTKGKIGLPLVIFTNPRYLNEDFDGLTLKSILNKYKIKYYLISDINNDKNLAKEITKNSLAIAMGSWFFEKKTVKKFSKNHLLDFMSIDLPRYRGGAHHSWRIMHQNYQSSINLQIIKGGQETFQKGEVIKRQEFIFSNNLIKPVDFYNYSLKKEINFFLEFINDIKKAKNFVLQRLDENQSSHYPSLFTKLHGLIDWSWQGKDIYLFINAFDDPYSGANAYWQGQKIYLSDCQLLPQPEAYHPFTSGLVVRQNKNGIFVATIGNLLQIKKVLDEKGREIFKKIKAGDRFYAPPTELLKSRILKVSYDNNGLKIHNKDLKYEFNV